MRDIFGEERSDDEYWRILEKADEHDHGDGDDDEAEQDSNEPLIDRTVEGSDGAPDLEWEDEQLQEHELTGDFFDVYGLDEDELEDELNLRDLPSTDRFFVSRQAAAVFKHSLLSTYFPKFAGKTASTEVDRRLVYVDTHAGRGEYDGGEPGSPLLIADYVGKMAAQRRIDCFFIEANRDNEARLRSVLKQHMPPAGVWHCRHGVASDHIGEAVLFAGTSPLFVFVDPYGFGPSFAEVVAILNRGRGTHRPPKTEVLLNFMASAVGRVGGYLRIGSTKQRDSSLASADAAMGGDWWRELYLHHTEREASTEAAVRVIAEEYSLRMAAATGCLPSLAPVRNRAHNQVLYWLVHFSRHPDGRFWIQHAAGKAGAAWRRHLAPPPAEAPDTLFESREIDPFIVEEARRERAWVAEIERSAEAVLRVRGCIVISRDLPDLYGSALGQATSSHLLRGLQALAKRGLLEPMPRSAKLERYAGYPPTTAP